MEPLDTPLSTAPDNGKTIAIVSYITLIGWIVALIMHSSRKSRLGAYHLRQMLGLMLLLIAISILRYPVYMIPTGWMAIVALRAGVFVLWIFGIVAAANGEEKPAPIVGDMFQKWFAGFAL